MLRVLHVTEALGGGLQSAIINYSAITPEHGHAVFARQRTGQATYPWPQAVPIETYEGSLLGFLIAARDHIVRVKPDIVHLHSSFAGLVRFMPLPSVSVVYSPHCYAMERTGKGRPLEIAVHSVEKLLSRRTDLVIAVSQREEQIARRLNQNAQCVVVPNFAPDHKGALNPSPTACSSKKSTVVMIGRISAQKDPKFFAAVAKMLPQYRFVWIGDGDEKDKQVLFDAGVSVSGWLPSLKLRHVLRESGLYLHTAAWEGAPLSTLEALSEGCAVLTRSIPSMTSLGYTPGGESADEVAEATHRYFTDLGYRQEVDAHSQKIAQNCNSMKAREALCKAYEQVSTVRSVDSDEQIA